MGERSGVLALAALAPSAMLVVDPFGWYPFGPSKWLAVSVLVLLGAGLVLRHRALRVAPALGAALSALVAVLVLAAVVGEDPVYAWIGTPERHFGVLTWVLCVLALVVGASLDVRRDIGPLRTGLLVASLGVGLVATLEAIGWEPELLDVGGRLTGTFGSSAYLGAATGLLLPIVLGELRTPGRAARRALAALALGLLAVACLGSGARAAWLGLVLAAVLTLLARRTAVRARARSQPGRAAALGGAAVVALVLVVVLTPAGARLSALADDDAPGGQGRLDEWSVAAAVYQDHPLLGVGPEGYRVAFHEGVDADYERAHGRERHPDRAHSGPLDLLLSGGPLALAAWLVVVGMVGRSVWRALRDGPPWLTGVAAGLVAHLGGQLVLFPLAELEPVAWLLAGVVVLHAPAGRIARPRVAARPLPIALLALSGVALAAGVADVVADHRADAAAEALGRADTDAAATAALDAVAVRPDIVRLRLLAAAALVADDQGTLAGLRQIDAALDVSPGDPIALLARARLLAQRAAATGVEAHLEVAADEVARMLQADPHNTELWRVELELRRLAGDDPGVRAAEAVLRGLHPAEERDR